MNGKELSKKCIKVRLIRLKNIFLNITKYKNINENVFDGRELDKKCIKVQSCTNFE